MPETPHYAPGRDLIEPSPKPGLPRTVGNTVSDQIRVDEPPGPSQDTGMLADIDALYGALPNIPGYLVAGVLGRGGMGVVYRAEQLALKRTVALKMIGSAGFISREELTRFRLEAEALARLQHPNIVQVHEVGEHDGLPFFSLEFVPGGTLAAKLDHEPQPATVAALMVEQLARAVTAAHAAGIIHRDLKPGNVLLTSEGMPKITDFGLAKRADTDSGYTRTGAVLGTPSYMSPEQASGRSDIGPGADIHALGAILYEMLTGKPPFQGETVLATIEQVRSQDAVPPRKLVPSVPRDLESICLRCLEKDFWRRYFTAESLADDLRRFIDGQPVLARPVGTVERSMKWVRRKPAIAGLWAVGCLLMLALTGAAVSIAYSGELATQRQRAEDAAIAAIEQRRLAEEREQEANTQRGVAELQKTALEVAKKEADAQRRRAERFKYLGDMSLAVMAWRENDPVRARGLLASHVPKAGESDLRGFEWHFLNRTFNTERWVWPIPEPRGIPTLDIKDDGTVCVVVPDASDGGIWLGNVVTGTWKNVLKEPLRGTPRLAANRVAFSAMNSTTVAFGDPEGTLRPPATSIEGLRGRRLFDLSPDGKKLAVVADGARRPGEKELRVYDIATRKLIASLPGVAEFMRPVFTPDSNIVATHMPAPMQRIAALNVTTNLAQQSRDRLPENQNPFQIVCPPSLPGIVIWLAPSHIELWQQGVAFTRKFHFKLPQKTSRAQLCMAISPDARRVAIAGDGPAIHIFGTLDGRKLGMGGGAAADVTIRDDLVLLNTLVGHEARVEAMAFTGDGANLVSVGGDRAVRVWVMESLIPVRNGYVLPMNGANGYFNVEKLPDSQLRVTDSNSQIRCAIPVDAGERLYLPPIAVPPGAQWVAIGSGEVNKPVNVWVNGQAEPKLVVPAEANRLTHALAASPDGRHLAILSLRRLGGAAGSVGLPRTQLWDIEARKLLWEREAAESGSVVFSPSGLRVAVFSIGRVSVLATETGEAQFVLNNRTKIVATQFLKDDELFVIEANATFTRVDLTHRRQLSSKLNQTNPVLAAGVSADGMRLATADANEVRVWDLETGQQTLSLVVDTPRPIRNLFFTRNDRCLIGDPGDGRVFEWDCTVKPSEPAMQ
ncbi:MAG: WD40 repeat domain-containing serine/threonine protein kinase [Gemmataceae bacterium]